MVFGFNQYSGLLLPFFVQGMVVAAVLVVRSRRNDAAADRWLALLLLLHALRLAQWMLGFAGWYDAHDAHSTFMFYFPFHHWLAVGPALYFYFRSLTNQEFRLTRRHWRAFGPELAWLGLYLVGLLYDVGWWHGLRGQPLPAHFGTKGPVAAWADEQPIKVVVDILSYVLVLYFTLRTLREYRAYARYLNDNFSDTDRIRFRWLRNVLIAVGIGTGVTLVFGVVNLVVPLSYYQAWYDYLFTGLLLYYLSIAGLLTGHRLASLRFQPAEEAPVPDHLPEPPTLVQPATAAPAKARQLLAAAGAAANLAAPAPTPAPVPDAPSWNAGPNACFATWKPSGPTWRPS
ncbi:hypothetical protein MUN84_20085 [Hymenobacter sp. 5516J-16]|uniref:hypothetical protein n=1 Tax=Hymenobacter sp. 5516J-16 TaxID=2932253 RepID=UPI001FD06236|nr:hypothetical protein [Hymenobacter sp. 5516J-16]UOQ76779.1 hypothetical protein MUN84_20085 [Hymenobacter sp. 5516J-16]